MAKRHKDFGQTAVAAEYEPLSFTLNDEEFFCRPAINGTVLLRFVREADSGEGGRSAGALLDFFDRILLPEDKEKFHALIDDEDTLVELETMGEIASWVVEQYSERPTQESSPSSGGRKGRGRALTAARSETA